MKQGLTKYKQPYWYCSQKVNGQYCKERVWRKKETNTMPATPPPQIDNNFPNNYENAYGDGYDMPNDVGI
jgi:hypothetical protein